MQHCKLSILSFINLQSCALTLVIFTIYSINIIHTNIPKEENILTCCYVLHCIKYSVKHLKKMHKNNFVNSTSFKK